MNYYNEIDKFAAQWLRNLIAADHIAPGIVDERSIEDVRPDDLRGFTQCHFFAGIGVWSYALRRAGWPDDRPVWTGSCPCQPFSQAGEGFGFDDERHLWPHFHWLIQERRPAAILGEQVASKDAEPWINLVHADLEGLGYAFGAVPFPSASVGAPHIRDRLFWGANANGQQHHRGRKLGEGRRVEHSNCGATGGLAHNDSHGRSAQPIAGVHHTQRDAEPCGSAGRLGHSDSERAGRDGRGLRGQVVRKHGQHSAHHADAPGADGRMEHAGQHDDASEGQATSAGQPQADRPENQPGGSGLSPCAGPGPTNGFWRDADWLLCRDGKFRPVEPGTFPLAHGASSRVGRLRAYGNAINAEAARVFIETVMEAAP